MTPNSAPGASIENGAQRDALINVFTPVELRLIHTIMEQVVAGNDVSPYATEAQFILNVLAGQRYDKNRC